MNLFDICPNKYGWIIAYKCKIFEKFTEIQTIPPFAMSGEQPDCSSKQFSAPLKKTPVMRKKYLACSDQSSDDGKFSTNICKKNFYN